MLKEVHRDHCSDRYSELTGRCSEECEAATVVQLVGSADSQLLRVEPKLVVAAHTQSQHLPTPPP